MRFKTAVRHGRVFVAGMVAMMVLTVYCFVLYGREWSSPLPPPRPSSGPRVPSTTAEDVAAPASRHRQDPIAARSVLPQRAHDDGFKPPFSVEDLQKATQCGGYASMRLRHQQARNVSEACHLALVISTLFASHLLNHFNISHWAMKGTLLGAVREGSNIGYDYDVDYGYLMEHTNEILRLRSIIWRHGFMLFEPPWGRYQNFQFVIMLRTTALVERLLNHMTHTPLHYLRDISAQHYERGERAWRLTKELEQHGVSVELMAFRRVSPPPPPLSPPSMVLSSASHKPTKAQEEALVQVLCTHRQASSTDGPFTLLLELDTLWRDFEQGRQSFMATEAQKRGWLSYASSQHDIEFALYQKRFGRVHRNRLCFHTAPYRFRYDSENAADVIPPHNIHFGPPLSTVRQGMVAVPHRPDIWLRRYFGPDYMTPKRRSAQDFPPPVSSTSEE